MLFQYFVPKYPTWNSLPVFKKTKRGQRDNTFHILLFPLVIGNKNQKLLIAFGKRIRELREARGLSQHQLAIDADISFNQIGRIERGEINCTINTIYYLAKALNVPLKELVDFPFDF